MFNNSAYYFTFHLCDKKVHVMSSVVWNLVTNLFKINDRKLVKDTHREIWFLSISRNRISRNVAHLNVLVHDVINLLYYEYWTDKQKRFYVHGKYSLI